MPSALANALTPTQVTFTFSGFPSAFLGDGPTALVTLSGWA